MNIKTDRKNRKSRIQLLHQYYAYTGFYQYIKTNIKKSIIPLTTFLVLFFLFERYILDIDTLFGIISEKFSTLQLYTVFLLSEVTIGLIPPELYIAWAKTLPKALLHLGLLSIISYAGGAIAYLIGIFLLKIKSIQKFVNLKMEKHIKHLRKWGGFLIIVGALTPVPYSLISMAAGIIKFDYKKYLLYGLFRFIRFIILGFAIFSLIN
ncbi:short-chain dehydrogenase [Puteibacter caeruleilacunae]|nr:short-chain dehydrogenase [Puteibacter caeruleilacunae]